ncbi:MAG: hypothetical protein LBJ31_06595 [Treponema sp.]|jgi:hypothetical protein|nr:hypothetical protein [Treponema sp.]
MEFHPINDLGKKMKNEVLTQACKLYGQESLNLNLKLKSLRGKYGVKQSEVVDNFSNFILNQD